LHEPHVKCYTKGKEHKKFEFGSKVSILVTQKTGVIVGALNFNDTKWLIPPSLWTVNFIVPWPIKK